MKKCYNCEKEIENGVMVDGELYCEECIEVLEIHCCDDCGEYHHIEYMYYIQDRECIVCESCFNQSYFRCNDCGGHRGNDQSHSTYDGNRYVCDGCVENYTYVDCCDTYICCDDVYWDGDYAYCREHYYERTSEIYDYHEFNDWTRHYSTDEINNCNYPDFCIGFELEVEKFGSTECNDMARAVKEMFPVICSHDGSLSNGFEIVSHPMSYDYIMENKDKLINMLEQLKNNNYRSHDTDTCGLHFHVSHPQKEEIIDRIILVMETYKDELIRFSRRTSPQINSWCKFLSDVRDDEPDTIKSLYYIKNNKEKNTRYMALNLTNYNTIEFRLFRGTLNFDTFLASVELVNNIVTLCSNLNIPVEEITWDRLNETTYARAYIDLRNIRTTIVPRDNTETQYAKENKLKSDIVEKLKGEVFEIIKNNTFERDILINCRTFGDINYNLSCMQRFVFKISEIINCCEDSEYTITEINEKLNEAKTMVSNIVGFSDIENILIELIKESEKLCA